MLLLTGQETNMKLLIKILSIATGMWLTSVNTFGQSSSFTDSVSTVHIGYTTAVQVMYGTYSIPRSALLIGTLKPEPFKPIGISIIPKDSVPKIKAILNKLYGL